MLLDCCLKGEAASQLLWFSACTVSCTGWVAHWLLYWLMECGRNRGVRVVWLVQDGMTNRCKHCWAAA